MKLFRYGPVGKEKPGIIAKDGSLRDLSKVVPDITSANLEAALAKIAKAKVEKLPVIKGRPRMGAPVGNIRKFVCIGLNYSDHAKETGNPIPAEPIIFLKADTAIMGPNDDVMVPRGSVKLDWEVELAVIIGKTARYVDTKSALKYVAGYATTNDVSERAFQMERGGTWDKGKGCDTFGPIGPWLVTRDEVKNPQNLKMWLKVNGRMMQNGTTKTMIFGVAELVSYVSHFMTLNPGDVISTGTPPGVGHGMKPPMYLKAGDVMEVGIEGLGDQRQKVVPFKLKRG